MTEFRRLISYIYEYEGKVKGKNVGFVKMETRNGLCKLNVSVKKLYLGSGNLGVYLLSARQEIFLGNLFLRNGGGEFRTVVQAADVEQSGESMDNCYGLTIHEKKDAWKVYTTIWEDSAAQAAEVASAPVMEASVPAVEKSAAENSVPMVEKSAVENPLGNPVGNFISGMQGNKPADASVNGINNTLDKILDNGLENKAEIKAEVKPEIKPEIKSEEKRAAEAVDEVEKDMPEEEYAENQEGDDGKNSGVNREKEETEEQTAEKERAAERIKSPQSTVTRIPRSRTNNNAMPARRPQGQMFFNIRPQPASSGSPAAPVPRSQQFAPAGPSVVPSAPSRQFAPAGSSAVPSAPARQFTSAGVSAAPGVPSPQPAPPVHRSAENQQPFIRQHEEEPLIIGDPEALAKLEEEEKSVQVPLWDFLSKTYPKIQAFECQYGCEILVIKPQDIGLLPREVWIYGNNSFLLHGYYNYRYLILARLENPHGTPRHLLGVPGHYYSNEKYMASMFGFPNFVLSKKQQAQDGRFGYWYTDIRLGDGNVASAVIRHSPVNRM